MNSRITWPGTRPGQETGKERAALKRTGVALGRQVQRGKVLHRKVELQARHWLVGDSHGAVRVDGAVWQMK